MVSGCLEVSTEGFESGYDEATTKSSYPKTSEGKTSIERQTEPRYSEQEIKFVMSQYSKLLDAINEDIKKLNQIGLKWGAPNPIPDNQYFLYASEYSIQLQYSLNHLVTFREFVYENENILKSQGRDTYQLKMDIADRITGYQNQAEGIRANLISIQYRKEQQQKMLEEERRQQEQLLELLLTIISIA